MEWSWIPWVLTLAGWVIANQLALKAQRKNFATQAKNAARLEIATAIREYQNWLSGVGVWALGLGNRIRDIEQMKPWAPSWEALWEDGRKRAYPEDERPASGWLLMLEEYEILFPKTREVRFALFDYNRALADDLNALLFSLSILEERKTAPALATKVFEATGELSAFMEDLRVYLQNDTLHEVTGNRVPYRVPGDPTVSRILIRIDGTPYIVPSSAPKTGMAATSPPSSGPSASPQP